MKQFLLFAFDENLAFGGWADFVSSFDTIGEAKEYIQNRKLKNDYYQIVDSVIGVIVSEINTKDD
jgi:hypothetical protein